MWVENRTLGRLNLLLLGLFLAYYSVWVLALPFAEADGPPWLRRALALTFPAPASVALGIPAALGTLVLGGLLARAYCLVCQDRREEEQKKKKRRE